jgi:hypothetical protein
VASAIQSGQPATFTATVTTLDDNGQPIAYDEGDTTWTPTGSVDFYDLTHITLLASGVPLTGISGNEASATFTTDGLPVGYNTIQAIYKPLTDHLIASCVVEVEAIPTTTVLTSSPNPSSFTQEVTFTATIAPAVSSLSVTPTGTVIFEEVISTDPYLSYALGTSALDSNGVATWTSSGLALGTHTLVAVYSGDSSFLGSSATEVTVSILPINTTTSLTYAVYYIIMEEFYDELLIFTATVAPSGTTVTATPTGWVEFYDVTYGYLGSAVLDTNGVATYVHCAFSLALTEVVAVYWGDGIFIGSISNTVSLI